MTQSPKCQMGLVLHTFQFTITYRPGTKTVKADALSRQFHSDPEPRDPKPLLPPTIFISPLIWKIDEEIAAGNHEAPPGGPEYKTYVPPEHRLTLIDSAHSVPGSRHPGSQQALSLLSARYWWPKMPSGYLPICPRMLSLCHLKNFP